MILPVQAPLGSGFDAATTAADVIRELDLNGHTAIVTGGYSGIGLETTRALAEADANVIVPARDATRAAAALHGIEPVGLDTLELTDAASKASFAERVAASDRPVSILIHSAGVMATPLMHDADGHEGQFATNHLGHFRLTLALWPALKAAEGARIVSLSSRGHQIEACLERSLGEATGIRRRRSGSPDQVIESILLAAVQQILKDAGPRTGAAMFMNIPIYRAALCPRSGTI